MGKKHEEFLNNIFLACPNKVIVAKNLGKLLCDNFPEIKKDNARKIIEGAYKSGAIKCSSPMTFGKNQYAYFSNKRAITYNLLKGVIKEYKPALHRVITKLFVNKGIICENEIVKLSGCRLSNYGHSIAYIDLISDLNMLNLVKDIIYRNVHFFYLSKWEEEKIPSELEISYKKIIDEATIISLFVNWLRKTNLVDNFGIMFRGEGNNFRGIENNNTIWDIFAFSSSLGTYEKERQKPILLVADCCISSEYNTIDFDGFRERVNMVIFSTKEEKRKVIPIIFSNRINPLVISNAKKLNYLIFDLKSLFGNAAIEIVNKYNAIKLIHNSETVSGKNETEQIDTVLAMIDKSSYGDNYGNLKGDLFEYLLRPVFEKIYREIRIQHRPLINEDSVKYEIDYLIDADNEYIFIELKGYKSQNIIPLGKYDKSEDKFEPNTVKWFLNRSYSKFREKYNKIPNKKCKFSYITTSRFDEKAQKVLAEKNNSSEKPDKMDCYYDGTALIKLLEQLKMENEVRILKQYYME